MDEQELITEGRGRSAKKREAKAVEELASQLVEIGEAELPRLPLDATLRRELDLARGVKGHSARRRQLKHFAGLLRRDDIQREALQAFFDGYQVEQAQATRQFHQLEDLRDRLCDPSQFDQALQDVSAELPHADPHKLANLARSVHASGDKKAAREIFRRLRVARDAIEPETD